MKISRRKIIESVALVPALAAFPTVRSWAASPQSGARS